MTRRVARLLLRGLAFVVLVYIALGYVTSRVGWLPDVENHAAFGMLDENPGRVARGVISIHTEGSHDATGTIDDVVRAARSADLDFALIGDHPPAREPWTPAEYRDSVLIGYGMELVFPNAGRGLLFGMSEPPDLERLKTDGFEAWVGDPDATAVVIHGRSPREREQWHLAHTGPMHAWEVMDVSESARRALASPWNVYHAGSLLLSPLTGSTDQSLIRMDRLAFRAPSVAAYDSMAMRAPITALAGLNHHPKTVLNGRPFPDFVPFFTTLVNHILLPEETTWAAEEDLRLIGAAIRSGQAFITIGNSLEAADFRLAVIDESGRRTPMGGEVRFMPGQSLATTALTPERGGLIFRALLDGREAGWYRGRALQLPLAGPGLYRVEVYRYSWSIGPMYFDLRPWIFSNPVRVVGPPEVELAALRPSDSTTEHNDGSARPRSDETSAPRGELATRSPS